MFKPSSIATGRTLDHKVVFLNSVFLFAGIVAFGMSFFRWSASAVMGSIDFIFSLCNFALVFYLNNHKERVGTISLVALVLSYGLFTAIYLLAPYNTTRISLFFLLSASAFFLKGRQAGLAWLILILLTIVTGHFLPGFDTAYSHIDIVTTCLYLLALFFIFLNYEIFKEKVNERDRDKEVLRLSEERFRTMIENGNDLISIISGTGMVRFISPSVESVLGFEPGEMVNKNINDLIHPDEQPKAATALASALAHPGGETLERYELRMKHKDGSYRDIEMAGCNLISNPVIGGIVLNGHDITERKLGEERLRQSEEKLRAYLDNISDTIWLIDANLNMAYVSPSVTRLLDVLPEELIGRPSALIIHPDDMSIIANAMHHVMEHPGEPHTIQYRVSRKVGRWIHVESTGVNMLGTPSINGVLVTMRDITARKLIEEALHESQARQRAILNNSPYMAWLKDTNGRYLKVNKVYADYARLEPRQIAGKTDFDLWPQELAEKYCADDAEVMASRQQKRFEELSFDGDNTHWVETFKTPVIDESGNVLGTTGFACNITERKRAEEQIRNLAFYDTLTQLPNRRLLNDRLGQTMAASKRSGRYGAVMFLDLDNFKKLNDMYGHDVGDLLLVEVARRITSCVREVDTVARFGGDEFVAILSELDVDKAESITQASIVAETIRATLAEPYMLKIQQEGKAGTTIEHHCTPSIGVVLFINYEASAEDILKWADMAMYQVKESGRNGVQFYRPAMQESGGYSRQWPERT